MRQEFLSFLSQNICRAFENCIKHKFIFILILNFPSYSHSPLEKPSCCYSPIFSLFLLSVVIKQIAFGFFHFNYFSKNNKTKMKFNFLFESTLCRSEKERGDILAAAAALPPQMRFDYQGSRKTIIKPEEKEKKTSVGKIIASS